MTTAADPPPKGSVAPLAALALLCFAANSLLARAALAEGDAGPALFTAVRLASGAATLMLLLAVTGRPRRRPVGLSALSGLALFVYAGAFSFAYLALDPGLGALILFGAVQATMFAGALATGERPGRARWLGGLAALGGLATLAAPGADAPPLGPALLMTLAGAAWGVFSLRGRRATDPVANMAAAFLAATPLGLLLWAALGLGEGVSTRGLLLAVASGAGASGLGYAVWYAVLPRMEASLAAVAQLTVPLIALAGGALWFGEPLTLRFGVAAALILGGVGAATLSARR